MIGQIGFGELVILGAGLFVYLIPSLVAYRKEIDAKAAAILANVLLGWTFIGWAVCLVWAIAAKTPGQKSREATEQATIQARVMADSYRREIENANEDKR
jgi:hypothetical protein